MRQGRNLFKFLLDPDYRQKSCFQVAFQVLEIDDFFIKFRGYLCDLSGEYGCSVDVFLDE